MTGLLGQFHALVDGGTGGNAIQMQYLKCAQTQRDKNFSIELGVGMLEEGLNLVVEEDLPAKHAEDEGCGEVAVRRGERVDGFAAKQIVGMRLAAFDCQQNVEGRFARR